MSQLDGPFSPRSVGRKLRESLRKHADLYLTIAAVAVVLVGLALLALGPLRTLLANEDGGDLLGEAADALDVGPLATGGSYSDFTISTNQVSRRFVPFTIIPDRPRDEVITYTVQPGDTMTSIAEMFGLDRTTVFWANADKLQGDVHMLQTDMELYIMPVDGVYHRSDGNLTIQAIAEKYKVEPETILDSEYNELQGMTAADTPPWGMRIVVPGGEGEWADWRPPIQEVEDTTTGTIVRAFMPGMAGSCAAGIAGSGGTYVFTNPLGGGYSFTQPFYPGHSGVDLAAGVGAPVLAADSGVVIFSGWNDWGYGNLVVLDHGNGWTTYYAHMSSIAVGCGQFVPRGGVVGGVGSTGNSSGPHLHFETRLNHIPDSPSNHIGF